MQFARINDVTIHYQVISAPADRPVIVFTNSLGTDFRIWRDVVVRLAGEFAIVLYDMRGHGLSDVGQLPSSIADHAEPSGRRHRLPRRMAGPFDRSRL